MRKKILVISFANGRPSSLRRAFHVRYNPTFSLFDGPTQNNNPQAHKGDIPLANSKCGDPKEHWPWLPFNHCGTRTNSSYLRSFRAASLSFVGCWELCRGRCLDVRLYIHWWHKTNWSLLLNTPRGSTLQGRQTLVRPSICGLIMVSLVSSSDDDKLTRWQKFNTKSFF